MNSYEVFTAKLSFDLYVDRNNSKLDFLAVVNHKKKLLDIQVFTEVGKSSFNKTTYSASRMHIYLLIYDKNSYIVGSLSGTVEPCGEGPKPKPPRYFHASFDP